MPDWLPLRGWCITKAYRQRNGGGYLQYQTTARLERTTKGVKRGALLHRVVMAKLLGRVLQPWEHVHHQDFNKLNACPTNLILMSAAFNPSGAKQDPYTAKFLSPAEWYRRYGQWE